MKFDWVLDGASVRANYYGTRVEGTVMESKVTSMGEIQYTVRLYRPYYHDWSIYPTNELLISKDQITDYNF